MHELEWEHCPAGPAQPQPLLQVTNPNPLRTWGQWHHQGHPSQDQGAAGTLSWCSRPPPTSHPCHSSCLGPELGWCSRTFLPLPKNSRVVIVSLQKLPVSKYPNFSSFQWSPVPRSVACNRRLCPRDGPKPPTKTNISGLKPKPAAKPRSAVLTPRNFSHRAKKNSGTHLRKPTKRKKPLF